MNELLIAFGPDPLPSALAGGKLTSSDGLLHVHAPESAQTFHDAGGVLQLRAEPVSAGHRVELSYEPMARTLRVRRDQVGVPAIYHSQIGQLHLVATDLARLVRARAQLGGGEPTIDKEAFALYLAYQYVPAPHTIWCDIRQLPANTRLDIGPHATARVFPDGDLPRRSAAGSIEEVGADALVCIETAACQGLEGSRSVAALLSGGMDTSTNVAILARLGVRPALYTASFAESAYDESDYARIVARHFDLDHRVLLISPDGDALPKIVERFESPHGDRAIFAQYFLCAAAAAEGHDTLVTGEGGDEILGYPRTRAGDEDLASLPDEPAALARMYLERTCLAQEPLRSQFCRDLGVDPELPARALEEVHAVFLDRDPFERLEFGQWRTWMTHGVYVKDARLARAEGLRTVIPFMNAALMNTIAPLPVAIKREGLRNKTFLKVALRGVLPPETLAKNKQKFWLPLAEWFRGPWCDLLRGAMLGAHGFTAAFLDPARVRRLIEEHERGSDHSRILWGLLFLELWGRGARR